MIEMGIESHKRWFLACRLKHKESMVSDMNDHNPVRIQRL